MRRLPLLPALLLAVPIAPDARGASGPATGLTSANVEWVTTLPYDAGLASGGRKVGNFFYVAGTKSLSIYDVTNPVAPQRLSTTPTDLAFPTEDVDTNGEILLLNDEQLQQKTLQVWDVRDKSAPRKLATLPGVADHTFTCLLRCAWAYGSRGTVVDLRDPQRPRKAGRWANGYPGSDAYDVTEVSPGIVLTSTRTMRVLDARNPTRPVELASGSTPDQRLIHSNRWPRNGADRWALVQGETPFSGRCTAQSGALMTWDTRDWRRTQQLRLADSYRVTNGTYADGRPAAGAAGCTAMWFQHHPSFRDGGLVAGAFFEHGARFLHVDKRTGKISERGWFIPASGATIATYWISDDIVYAVDLEHGIDVLRFRGGRATSRAPAPTPQLRFWPSRNALWCQPA